MLLCKCYKKDIYCFWSFFLGLSRVSTGFLGFKLFCINKYLPFIDSPTERRHWPFSFNLEIIFLYSGEQSFFRFTVHFFLHNIMWWLKVNNSKLTSLHIKTRADCENINELSNVPTYIHIYCLDQILKSHQSQRKQRGSPSFFLLLNAFIILKLLQ